MNSNFSYFQKFYFPTEDGGTKENMNYGANSSVFQIAEQLRNHMTRAEEILWNAIHINEWKLKF